MVVGAAPRITRVWGSGRRGERLDFIALGSAAANQRLVRRVPRASGGGTRSAWWMLCREVPYVGDTAVRARSIFPWIANGPGVTVVSGSDLHSPAAGSLAVTLVPLAAICRRCNVF